MADKLARAKLARASMRFHAQSGAVLPPLVLMTDDERLADPIAAACALPRGSMIILRSRNDARRAMLAEKLRPLARKRALKFLIANDTELARRTSADGIHLAEAHAQDAAHWRARHPRWIITAAAHSLRSTHTAHADAIILGSIFATQSHPGTQPLGPTQLRIIARLSLLPVYAVGGIDAMSARRLDGAELAGLAAIGALSAQAASRLLP